MATLGVAIAGLPLLYFLRFDFNPMNLRSATVESVATYLDLRRDPATGANSVNVLVPSVQAADGSFANFSPKACCLPPLPVCSEFSSRKQEFI